MSTSYLKQFVQHEKAANTEQSAPTKLTKPQDLEGFVSFVSALHRRSSKKRESLCHVDLEPLTPPRVAALEPMWGMVEAAYRMELSCGPLSASFTTLPNGEPITHCNAVILRAVVEVERSTPEAEAWLELLRLIHADWSRFKQMR